MRSAWKIEGTTGQEHHSFLVTTHGEGNVHAAVEQGLQELAALVPVGTRKVTLEVLSVEHVGRVRG